MPDGRCRPSDHEIQVHSHHGGRVEKGVAAKVLAIRNPDRRSLQVFRPKLPVRSQPVFFCKLKSCTRGQAATARKLGERKRAEVVARILWAAVPGDADFEGIDGCQFLFPMCNPFSVRRGKYGQCSAGTVATVVPSYGGHTQQGNLVVKTGTAGRRRSASIPSAEDLHLVPATRPGTPTSTREPPVA